MARNRVEGKEENVGKGQYANLPQDVLMEEYPKSTRLTVNENIDDSMVDIDDICDRAEMKRKKYLSNQK